MSPSWKAGAYAALTGEMRRCPDANEMMMAQVMDWYDGFDAARARLAALEGELIRGEKPR